MSEIELTDIRAMLVNQNELQLSAYGINIAYMSQEGRVTFIKEMYIALGAELQEMLNEMSWKPWASAEFFNTEEALGEMVDAWHFIMNILITVGYQHGVGPNELGSLFAEKYYAKSRVNAERQENGYDGVSSKCPSCHREVTELPPSCFLLWYCTCTAKLSDEHIQLISLSISWSSAPRAIYISLMKVTRPSWLM